MTERWPREIHEGKSIALSINEFGLGSRLWFNVKGECYFCPGKDIAVLEWDTGEGYSNYICGDCLRLALAFIRKQRKVVLT